MPVPDVVRRSRSRSGAIVRAAKDVGEALDVKALATFTQTGETAKRLAALHPRQPLLAFTVDARVRSQLALSWGVETFLVPVGRAHRRHGRPGGLLAAVDRPAQGRRPGRRRRRQPAEHRRAPPTSSACTKWARTHERRRPATARPPRSWRSSTLEEREPDVFVGQTPRTALQRIFGGQVAGQALMAAGLTVPEERPVHSLHSYFLRPGRPARGDPLRRRPDPRRPVVQHPPGGRLAGPQGRGRRDLRADRGLPRGRRSRCAEHSLPMPRRARPGDAAVDWPRWPAGTAHRRGLRWRSAGQVVEQRLLEDPFDRAAEDARRTPQSRAWMRVAGRLPDDAAVHAAALTFVSDLTLLVGRAGPARRRRGRTSSGRASTTRCGSTGRCGPTSGSSTRPTARRPRAAGRCASARSGPPTARTSPPWPRRASPVVDGLTASASSGVSVCGTAARPRRRAPGLRRRLLGARPLLLRPDALLLGPEPLLLRRSLGGGGGEVGGQPVVALAQQRPHPLDVRPGGGRGADRPPGARPARATVVWVRNTSPPSLSRSSSVMVATSASTSSAHRGRRQTSENGCGVDDLEPVVGVGPAGELLGQGDVAADVGAQPLGAVPAQHEPQLQRPEPAAERDLPVAVVDDGAGVGGGVAQVLREDRQRAGQRGPVGDPEERRSRSR